MKVYVTKRQHGKYNYLLNWRNPETGGMIGVWFATMKEINEYISEWDATVIRVP